MTAATQSPSKRRIGRAAWGPPLEAARAGDAAAMSERLAAVTAGAPAFPGAHELLEGLCLAEAGEDAARAVGLLTRACELNPANILAPHALALARMEAGERREARRLLEAHRLPHDLDLLGCVALRLEADLREAHPAPPDDWPEWPGWLARPGASPVTEPEPDRAEGDGAAPAPEGTSPEAPAPPAVPLTSRKVRRTPSGGMSKILAAMEADFFAFDYASVLRRGYAGFETGEDNDELQLIAGIACEEAGDPDRGRAHLARALSLEPKNYMARAHLGRIYAQLGWHELAGDLWRSLPIEGPDDSGRHYHLAIGHAAAGDRPAARAAMRTALRDFFIDTREFYIERAWLRWRRLNDSADATAGA